MFFSDQVQIRLEMVTLFAWLISTPKQSFKLAFMCQHGNISLLAETKREWFFYDHPTRNIWMYSGGLCRESMFLVFICWDWTIFNDILWFRFCYFHMKEIWKVSHFHVFLWFLSTESNFHIKILFSRTFCGKQDFVGNREKESHFPLVSFDGIQWG